MRHRPIPLPRRQQDLRRHGRRFCGVLHRLSPRQLCRGGWGLVNCRWTKLRLWQPEWNLVSLVRVISVFLILYQRWPSTSLPHIPPGTGRALTTAAPSAAMQPSSHAIKARAVGVLQKANQESFSINLKIPLPPLPVLLLFGGSYLKCQVCGFRFPPPFSLAVSQVLRRPGLHRVAERHVAVGCHHRCSWLGLGLGLD